MRNIEEILNRQINRWNSVAQTLRCSVSESASEKIEAREALIGRLHPPICISRDLGSGAREVAREVCARLGYTLFGKSIIDEIAKDLQVQRRLVDTLDERGQSELELIIETFLRGRELDSSEYFNSLVRVVNALALKGGVVLLGRGGAFILREKSALSVLITGPFECRVRRLMEYENLDENTAQSRIMESDRQRQKFVRKYFKSDIHLPEHYDLTINTCRIDFDGTVDLILRGLAARGYPFERLRMPQIPG